MSRKCLFIGLLLSLSVLTSCEEEKVLPSYRQDLAELLTDASGQGSRLFFDDGGVLNLSNRVTGLVADTIYRVQVLYVEEGHDATLYSARTVISPFPVAIDSLEVKMDPVTLKSSWASPRYLNFLVGVKTGGGKQSLGFVEKGIEEYPTGIRKLKLALYHGQEEDPLYYTEDVYLSCPIYGYVHELEKGRDSIEMEINTFEGIRKEVFIY